MKQTFSYAAIACIWAFVFANANAGQPTPDTNLIEFGSTNVSYLNTSENGISDPPDLIDSINYDPFNSNQQSFDQDWYKEDYAESPLEYGDGTVIEWRTGGTLPIGYGAIDAFTNSLTGTEGFATELLTPDNQERWASYYRIPVNVTQRGTGALLFEYIADDGAAVYLDGEPWFRVNCCNDPGGVEIGPNTEPWFNTVAFNATNTENELQQIVLPSGLSTGNHLIAVSLHSNAPTSSDQGLDFRVFTPGNYRPWGVNESGNWSNAANWEIDTAGSNEFAIFGDDPGTAAKTVFTDSAITLDGVQFEGGATYAIAGTGAVNIAGRSGQDGSLNVLEGSHAFQVKVNLNKDTDADVAAGASVDFDNELGLNSNTLTKVGDGDLIVGNDETVGNGMIDVMAGVLGGGGTVGGDVLVNGGVLAPGGVVDPLGSAALLTINGDASVNTGGFTLNAFSGNSGDGVSGGGTGTLTIAAGTTLTVNNGPGFTPSDGDFIDAFPGWSSISGTLEGGGWALDASTGRLVFGVDPGGAPCDLDMDGDCDITDINSLIDTAGVTPEEINQWLIDAGSENGFAGALLPGDANLDGSVNPQDLNQLGQNWLGAGTTWESGDFNGDDTTDAQDLNAIGQNWLGEVPSAAAAATVPEPSAFGLVILALLGGLRFRRRSN